jgi:peptide/nickel transport system ATP-binding protein
LSALLEVEGLRKYFPIQKGLLRRTVGHVRAVDGVSFDVARGETLGVVGESGCGKTTLGRCLMRLIEPTEGAVRFHDNGSVVDLTTMNMTALRPYRRRMQMVFQDPFSSLNPRMTVADLVGEPLRVNRVCSGSELHDRVSQLVDSVGLKSQDLRRYPHAFSGGQRQRIGIARALALKPDLIVADEPVSALDVSVQAQILNLLVELREEFQLSYVFIAHDLAVVEHISDRIAVMYLGRVVEIGESRAVYAKPRHPYTEALMSAVPIADPNVQRTRARIRLDGEVPDPSDPPSGCPFHPRCRYATDVCSQDVPVLRDVGDGVQTACHLAEELSLEGVEGV